MYDITITSEPARRVVGIEHKGVGTSIGAAFKELWATCGAQGLWPQVRAVIAVHFDDPDETPEGECRSLAAVELAGDSVPEGLVEQVLAGGRTAVLTYKGPYDGLEAAYRYLYGTWLAQAGAVPSGQPPYEIYLNSPEDTAPENLLTAIHVPLAEAQT